MNTIPAPPPPPPICNVPNGMTNKNKAVKKQIILQQRNADVKTRKGNLEPLSTPRKLCSQVSGSNSAISNSEILVSYYQGVDTVLQDGPMCGIVSLSMASRLIGKDMNTDKILNSAKEAGYTKSGELFSAENVLQLAKGLFGCDGSVLESTENTGENIIRCLCANKLILAPYDRDHNNEPCSKKGIKAHWAVLSGFVLHIREASTTNIQGAKKDNCLDYLYHTEQPINKDILNSNILGAYVYANQGKSLHTHLWNVKDLISSNNQMYEIDPSVKDDFDNYLIPPDKLTGLRGKFVVLNRDTRNSR